MATSTLLTRVTRPVPVGSVLTRPGVRTSTFVVAALVALNLATHLFGAPTWVRIAAVLGLLVVVRRRGLTWSQLGLGRARLRVGAVWAAASIAAVAAVYAVGLLLPFSRQVFLDVRYHLPVPEALTSAFFVIPVGTVLAEEIAFRSVLHGVLTRHMSVRRAVIVGSVAFGLWHVLPSLRLVSANAAVGSMVGSAGGSATLVAVATTVLFTTVAGVVLSWWRMRSGSLLASIGMHWATNGLGVLFGIAAWHLVR